VSGIDLSDLLARCTFAPPGTAVDCAVSGGPDSMALMVLAVEAGLDVTAWHVDHGLRPVSASEGELVARTAVSVGAAVMRLEAPVEHGPNLEARAREARISVLPAGVLTGHTADDQAETVIMNILRGAGIQGAAGIGDPGRRPLLAIRRAETTAVCASAGITPAHDTMNDDPRFFRNRVRHEIVPLMAEVSGRDPVPLLARHADRAREAVGLLVTLVAGIDATDVSVLSGLSDDLARLALRKWLTDCSGGRPPDLASVDRVLEVARGSRRAAEVVGGHRVERSAGRLTYLPG